jgi:TonB family protein
LCEKSCNWVCRVAGGYLPVCARRLLLLLAAFAGFGISAAAQDSAAISAASQSQLDALATRVSEHIRTANLDPQLRKIFVIDFSNASDRGFSKLGALLADDFAKSVSSVASGFEVADRAAFAGYLKENLIGLDDLQSQGVCLTLVRSMGGAGVVRGILSADAHQQVKISVSLEGLGPIWSSEAEVPLTDALQELWKQPAASYVRAPEAIPTEPGIYRPGEDGASLPVCIFCPSPDYTDLARVAQYRGTVELSLIVTNRGDVNSVVVLRGAPFALNKQAIEAVEKWKFKPAKRNSQAVSVRVPVDIEFQLY